MDWKTEIQTGPLAIALAPFVEAGDDATVVAMLNDKTIDTLRSVSRMQFIQWAAKTGMRATIQDVSVLPANDPAAPLRSVALALLDVVKGGGADGINFANPDNVTALNAWVTFEKLSVPHRDALLALATVKISRAEASMGRDATVFDVANALRNEDGSAK